MSEERSEATAKQNKSRRWRPTNGQALWAVGLASIVAVLIASVVVIRMGNRLGYVPLGAVVLLIFIRLGYRYEWTGFGETTRPKTEKREVQPRKTLWDWMQLLFVPAMLAVLAAGVTWWQTSSDRARQAEEAARQEALRAQNDAVQTYLDQMTALMLDHDLRNADLDDEVRTIAQARTSAVLRAVEPENRRTLLQFLSDAGLIQPQDPKHDDPPPYSNEDYAVISLNRADLTDTDLRNINLRGTDLHNANLSDTYLSRTKLHYANLANANLSGAYLRGANLHHVFLSEANLSEANLSDADLRGATGIAYEELEEQAASLEGATMPNGQKYEDWLKSKGRGEEGENSGP